MFPKSFIAPLFLFALTSSVNAHAAISPALGVKGTPSRNDVQRPSTNKPCGNVDIGKTLDSSTAVPADASGTFAATAINFNPGADGSRSIKTVLVDASGTGNKFVPAKMVVNGDPNPTDDSPQQLTVQLPDGTKCTGGTSKDLCLASFATTSGFGNCVVVSQGSGAANPAPSPSGTQANPVRNGAAKGMKRATPTDPQDPSQPSESGKNAGKKNKNKGKADAKKGKKGDKAKNGNKGKNATKQAGGNSAARRMTPKRHWSSRS